MHNTSYPILLMMMLLSYSCNVKTYRISEKNLTTLDAVKNRRYIDVAQIAVLPAGKAVFRVKADSLFIAEDQEFSLKTGWTLQGKSGNETLIKEQSSTTSAIRVEDADDIIIKNLGIITSGLYTPAKSNALILIDNEAGKNLQGIEISRTRLSGHFSGITVRRGNNVRIEDCHLYDNAHQIYLGDLDVDSDEIHQYRVDNVQILRTKITDGKKADSTSLDGIKTRSNCTNILISGCRIERNWGDAIDLYPGGLDVEIIDNDLSYNNVHGVEVKMNDSFHVEQTGQIEHVLIYGNRMVNNGNNGIRIYDTLGTNYAQGIEVRNNTIDSSGHYGIESRLPVVIDSNCLRGNGLTIQELKPKVGYTGILLLDIIRQGEIVLTNNQIIDQAPINTTETTYWISLNNVQPTILFERNKLSITKSYYNSFTVAPYGVSIIDVLNSPPLDSIWENNIFSLKFTCRIVHQLDRECTY